MKWMQFFTPVSSLTWQEAHKLVQRYPTGDVTFLDVRQPKEYEGGHLPGAKLIPLGNLEGRLDELDREKPIILYCAIGGRSRVAAQMLAGKDFRQIYNLSGGIKAWEKEVAVGPEDIGLHLFSVGTSPEEALIAGFGLEAGLRDFYTSMQKKVTKESTKSLFGMLADIEILHQKRLVKLYVEITGTDISLEDFSKKIAEPAMEGGLTTEEYLQLYKTDLESEIEVLGLALAIEAQALDLYSRAAQRSDNHEEFRNVLLRIAEEERGHMAKLSTYIDQHQDVG
jgi:rhodanese-related sulfurtransferase/rubrerythrin